MNTPTEYRIEAPLLQQIVSRLAALPWAEVNHILSPLMATVQAQEAAAALAPLPPVDPAHPT